MPASTCTTRSRCPADHPLTKLDNVTLMPHLGYVVEDSYRHFYAGTIEDIEAWLDGKPINVINPDALKKRDGVMSIPAKLRTSMR